MSANQTRNRAIAENFKATLYEGRVHSPPHRLAQAELPFLLDDGHRIDHPTTGPCTTKDIVDALFEVTAALTELAHDPGRRLGGLGLRPKAWPRYGSEGEIFEASQRLRGRKQAKIGVQEVSDRSHVPAPHMLRTGFGLTTSLIRQAPS